MEILDVYDKDGKLTGKTVRRGYQDKELLDNEYVAIAQIYIENDKGEYLIEESAKKTGNRFLPVGGHISHGETPTSTILREVEEEIGLDITNENVVSLGYIISDVRLRFIYYLKKNVDINSLSFQKEEVLNVSYKSVDEINDLIDQGLMHHSHRKMISRIEEYKKSI